jgi:glutamate-ammonia-ligase adenylyltransferase
VRAAIAGTVIGMGQARRQRGFERLVRRRPGVRLPRGTASPRTAARHHRNAGFFERLGRRVIAALTSARSTATCSASTCACGPTAKRAADCVVRGARAYLVAQGRAWERYAWLKARPLDRRHDASSRAGRRRSSIASTSTTTRTRACATIHRADPRAGEAADYARDIKLGRGGIREIEFVVQALQIVRGGREPSLRVRGTRAASRRWARAAC